MSMNKHDSAGSFPNGISIVQENIVMLQTDAVVNAANEGLMQGGGVCGAIFKSAGADKLRRACNEIGHCPTGGAVITPGFELKAKYIIHSVGPVWRGGDSGEADLLYSAYSRSLEVAKENGCHSIGFPLISAGIFGYPLEEAWQIAIKACRDFINANKDYDLAVVFAVLDHKILDIGNKIKNML